MHVIQNQAADAGEVRSTPVVRQGVLLINLGTPDRPDTPAVRRYLAEFLSDPSVIRLPSGLKWMNGPLGHLIALMRAPSSAKMYKKIWTQQGSPLKTITEDQVRQLEQQLSPGWRVFYAMRYGKPSIRETLQWIVASEIEKLVVVPMYPQFSDPTTGTVLRVFYRELQRVGTHLSVTIRTRWYDDTGYTHAQAARIHTFACEHGLFPDNTHLLFSAHSLPVAYIRRGDPYAEHIARTVKLVTQRLGWPEERFSLAYQSRLGPVKWLGPGTDDVLMQLADEGKKRVLVCPISFTADCLETLEEIGLRYLEKFEQTGGELFLCPALNTYEPFIQALKGLVWQGPRPITSWNHRTPLFHSPQTSVKDADIASLVMVGVSLPGRLGQGLGPVLQHTDIGGLCKVKRSQCDVPELLRVIRDQTGFREAWLFNTCHRFEFYGWLPGSAESDPLRTGTLERTRRYLFGEHENSGLAVNVLYGAKVYHQLLRTVAGLNSALPGERDIRKQLQAAHRLAHCAGTAGPLAEKLFCDVLDVERELRSKTGWGHYDPDYCFAALSRILKSTNLDLFRCRVVVIGGSTTSASVLTSLIEQFDIPSRQLTLLYRGHKKGGQIKLLRKAVGHGQRIRVQSYAERAVTRAIAQADMVIFGIDRERPVIDARQLVDCRDFSKHPLWIMDFNMFGSTSGVESIEGVHLITSAELDAEVSAYADEVCNSEPFARAVETADRYIFDHVRSSMSDDSAKDTTPQQTPVKNSEEGSLQRDDVMIPHSEDSMIREGLHTGSFSS